MHKKSSRNSAHTAGFVTSIGRRLPFSAPAGLDRLSRIAGRAAGTWALRKPVTAVLLLGAATAQAGPMDGQVTSGAASISQSGANTTITQSSQNASLSWKSFNIGAQESVNFVQPSASAIAVNRILDTHGSQILGHLNANGQVYLINPNGVLFGAGAQVNVGGLVASTLDIKDADLNGSQRSFSGAGTGSVVNQGSITAARGGYVALIGNTVSNQGNINAPLGSVALAAGSAATLTFQDSQLLKIVVDQSVLNSLAENGGLILANGGQVLMSAGARDSLQASVVNNSGVIQARTVENRNGTIILLGGMSAGTTKVAGTLDASAPDGGNGGFIETSGAHVNVADSARITTAAPAGNSGTWLIDPVDFTVAASGGDITGAALGTNLGAGNVVIQSTSGAAGTAGDVNVNDAVSWSANQLTLNAQNNININSNLSASGTGKLALEYGQGTASGAVSGVPNSYNFSNGAKISLPAGNNFSTKQGSAGTPVVYTVITDLGTASSATGTDLQGISGNLSGSYVLGADIDASPTSTWNAGNGFKPLGNSATSFSGTLDGLGHTVTGLTINRPTTDDVGLFGRMSIFGHINNLGLVGGSVSGQFRVGALVGWNLGKIYNSYTDNTPVTGSGDVIGGLVGLSQGPITNSHAGGAVSGSSYVGGLVGWGQDVITNSYAAGNVTSTGSRAGGLVGDMLNSGAISGSYASGNVSSTGGGEVGGLVGAWDSNGAVNAAISNSYATGTVSGTDSIGGLVGHKVSASGTINNSYAAGTVSGTTNAGGLVGLWDAGTGINNSFWDVTTTGRATSSGGGTGMTTAQMQQQANFNSATAANGNVNPNWDFTSVWRIYEGNSRPLLKALMKATTVTVGNTSKTYDKLAWNGGTGISCSNTACSNLLGSISFGGAAQGAVNVGSYAVTGSGLYSNQQGYDISYANGTLTVNPASLVVTGVSAANKVYDATTGATLNGTAGVTAIAGDTVNVAGLGSATFADKNAGNGKAVTVTGYTLSGADAGNYTVVQPTGLTANITPASLAVTGVTAVGKVYDSTRATTFNGTATVTPLGADVVLVGGANTGIFTDKNVGTGKGVTGTGYFLGGADANNYVIVQPTGTANITPASLTVSGVGANNKVYDANTTATLNGTAAVAAFAGDTVTVTGSGSGTFADKNVGNGKAVTVAGYTLGGADAGNYTVVQPTGVTANITPAGLTVTGVGANNKVYDTTTAAALNGTASVTALGGDVVTVGGTGSGNFANKNVGNGKTVTITGYTLGGADAGNYTVVQPTGVTANITPASLAVTGVGANNKVYDANATATLNGTAAVAAFAGDTVSVTGAGSGAFADKNVGNGKAVTVTGYTLGGADAGNYVIVQPSNVHANITPAGLTVTGVGANNKVYDTTTAAALNGTASVTALGGDVVTVGGTGSGNFANKNVGNGKTVTITGYTLGGADAGNYTVVQPVGVTANITPASVTVTGVGANNKVYDANTTATLNGTASVAALAGDVVTVGGGSGTFANKNVGNGKAVTVTGYTLGGADAGNYTVVQPTGVTANITPASLTVTGVGANNKVYDTTAAATLNGAAAVTALGGDVVTVGGAGSGSFADKNVGNGKAVTVTGYTLGGVDAGNYTVVQPTGVTANITPASLTVSGVSANNKVYDATTTAALSGTAAVTALGGDTVTVGGGSGTFANKNVGNGKAVTVTGYTLGGADAGNYTVVQPVGLTANITPASVTVTGVGANNKIYDTTATATLNGTASVAALGGDVVTVGGGSGTFANKNVGNGKVVTVTGYTLGGADAGNYTVVQPTGVTANITPASLAVTGVGANNKVYDASTAATLTGAASVTALGGDSVSVSGAGSGNFADKNVGNGKAVTVTGYTLSGADAANYAIVQPTGVTANITPASVAVTGVGANNKVYDTTTTATLNGTASVAALGADVLTVGGGIGTFADKNVANGKAVTVTGYTLGGADAGNYVIVQPAGVTANITPAGLAVTGVGANNKVYDATTTATLNGTASVTALAGDVVGVTGTGHGAFADANVGNGKAVTVTGYTLNGADAGNYTVLQPAGLTAAITPLPAVPIPPSSASSSAASSALGSAEDGIRSAKQEALETALSKSDSLQASTTVRVTRGSSTDASSGGGDGQELSGPSIELQKELPASAGRQDPRLHIVDGGVQLRSGVLAAKK